MTTCVIMQPCFIPWAGYFNLIHQADYFVFLDDVQYQKRSWQVRNRILLNGEEHLLTVPVEKCSSRTRLNEVRLSTLPQWQDKHLMTLKRAYAKSPFSQQVLPIIDDIYRSECPTLSQLNISIIEMISRQLGLNTQFILASELNCSGKRTEHLIQICNALSASEYLSPQGSKEYLLEDRFEESSGLKLRFQQFEACEYPQKKRSYFLSHLSIIDVIAHLGLEQSRAYCTG
ncbi:WbqC family protein [Endozoicomonas arenosclerae]|uniref:WbqC family protein n=1 Tax=Endozoicomonas arenosclerae TaxID=1633495 RepID=UPI0007857319|nr:WbqC family protein [Endozoicomonas arenosclerae]